MSLTTESAVVKETCSSLARPIIEKYEWLGTLPLNYSKFVGLFFSGNCAGVICFVSSKFGADFSLWNKPAICLGRGACVHWCPPWGASFLIQRGISLLYGHDEPRYVLAYSDWSAGEIGTVYQACGWTYLGHRRTKEWLSPDGERFDCYRHANNVAPANFGKGKGRSIAPDREAVNAEKARLISCGWKLVDGPIRGRYATTTGRKGRIFRSMVKQLLSHGRPYPKRGQSIKRDTPTQSEGRVQSPLAAL